MNKKNLLILFLFPFVMAHSQAGTGIYQFLHLPVSSRLTALGGVNVSLNDHDINMVFQNPSLLSAETNNTLGLSMANYYDDIRFGTAAYGHTFGKNNYLALGILYVDYGKFRRTLEENDPDVNLGSFTAKDFALNIAYARPLNKYFTVGGTLKPVYSALENYTSYGVALDAGISYKDSSGLFSTGLVFKNIGTQIKGYYSDEDGQHYEPLPFNIQLGLTKKFKHAPLRFSFTLHNLQHWDLSYQSTNQANTSLDGESTKKDTKIGFVDMFFRHTITAVEFVPSKNFYVTVAYNHRRQKEMSVDGFKSGPGFSFGGGVKIYKFHVGFGTARLQTGVSSYMFSISTALNDFRL